jgi:phosphate-selective porin OprO/OprP
VGGSPAGVHPHETTTFSVGNFRTVALEALTSGRYTTFMERGPYADVLGLSRTVNLAAGVHGERWSFLGAVSGDNINELDVAGDEMVGVSGRLTFAPVVSDTTALHLGGWVRHRDRGDDDALRYRARPNTNYGARYIDTGAIGRSDTTLALEAAAVLRNVSVQGEYGRLTTERSTGDEVGIDTFYAFVSWFPTGETRNYSPDTGEFGRTKIKRPVTDGGSGAVEIALRYDHADLSDAHVPGVAATARAGEYNGVTLGVNWYPITYVRFMANYTRGDNDNPGSAFDAETDTFQVRTQYDF